MPINGNKLHSKQKDASVVAAMQLQQKRALGEKWVTKQNGPSRAGE
jgi:hypothetical protein